ncbi:L-threonine 3-O-phosphate decarboxylase [Buttiauxella noackiae ATCC 51607]|uniref:threonine-phosphate decarboxylase n=1 Tax=Buttiauxella noackiae ATCC 51607 TaxID=1354255 RepID=A0A1B7HZU2_9ENTR|nr:threonine-phosphate decarboxylase CobD [Buttiauxella noackiae]OAT21159.1 L-threonine 3-O-phosphate decarboxylase [Buttiauxella noackiae ATCC 51607]
MAFSSQHGGNIIEAATVMGVDAGSLIDFSANINPLGMPDSLKRAITENLVLAERYPDVEYRALHQALAEHHQVPLEWVLAGNGETELIFNLVQQLLPRKALLLTPGFAEYRRALTRINCEIIDFHLSEEQSWQPDESLLQVLTPDLDCLFLCTPNNPTGLMPDKSLLLAIAQRCQENHIDLIIDEAFLDFLPDEPGLIPHLAKFSRLYVLRSLTKFFAIAGLRLGYMVSANTDVVGRIRAQREPWTINAFAALAGEVILNDREYIEASYRWLSTEQPRLFKGLSKQSGITVWPPRANYIFLRCEIEGLDLQRRLLEKNILIRHCANYPGLDSRYYRVAIKSPVDNDKLLAAMQCILSNTDGAGE